MHFNPMTGREENYGTLSKQNVVEKGRTMQQRAQGFTAELRRVFINVAHVAGFPQR